ncbi:hypothetical protein T484DRAFT_1902852, partial [Baffinella frigidus]
MHGEARRSGHEPARRRDNLTPQRGAGGEGGMDGRRKGIWNLALLFLLLVYGMVWFLLPAMDFSLAKRFGWGGRGSARRQSPAEGCKGFGYVEVCQERDSYARAHRKWLSLRDARRPPCSKAANKQRLYLAESAFAEHKNRPGFLSSAAVVACNGTCEVVDSEAAATVVMYGRDANSPSRKGVQIAVFNMEAHNSVLPHADILVNFRSDSEVPVSYAYGFYAQAGECKDPVPRRGPPGLPSLRRTRGRRSVGRRVAAARDGQRLAGGRGGERGGGWE